MSDVAQIIIAALGGGGLFSFITFLITRFDKRHEDKNEELAFRKEVREALSKNEKDTCRTQLLLLMSDYPDNVHEIMMIAQHYFEDDKGNWYMTSLFSKWLCDHGIEKPDWVPKN